MIKTMGTNSFYKCKKKIHEHLADNLQKKFRKEELAVVPFGGKN